MKHTTRHGLLWDRVDRIQTAPDMRKETSPVKTGRVLTSDEWELKNAFRL